MKFKKFVKSIGADGMLYTRKNGERWLCSDSIYMKVPEDIHTITAIDCAEIPPLVEDILSGSGMYTRPCELTKAIMPHPNGVIKDCVRIYSDRNNLDTTAISNDGYVLIERGDVVEMYVVSTKVSALVIKRPVPFCDEMETVGLIFNTVYEEE